ncbi:TfoX/Sxy family protein [Paenarthrobacter aurescens]|uniref:TfoX N-terminal domain-containing protein n=1 Tax=Paenarthrobacter aurescens TaxID=43663 RepID=A0A4Y3NIE7_PAEAU|nr:TfoX/Sxy family protein [Paenarthrobacter aurescens]MDO6142737.1 TfoX/Sxy family protein [Paenarthrobacter aurescens]MDO6146583.1 TfoX/Sxy family protein [Paenarthrobacter aurescens]MDO6157829.1 TfoX/Sxy family protein [Paenarthrobacter aurescens]MDO6161813.1 TfoX/Sxy family protein [Paenarthrobacter aurescens]GEB18861.1 hypothetical protein AAU01_16160 [Paenarthrobacter aurescens]
MQMPKPSEADKERFRSVVPDHPDVVVKPMFGNLGAFVNGNMFAGLFGPTIGVKLSETDKADLESSQQTQPFGPEERPMGGYVGLPEGWNDHPAEAEPWVAKAFAHVASLPAKEPKAKAPKKKV